MVAASKKARSCTPSPVDAAFAAARAAANATDANETAAAAATVDAEGA